MKNYLNPVTAFFLIAIITLFIGCSKDDNPVTSAGSSSPNGTLIYTSTNNVDSAYYSLIMVPRTSTGVYDFTNSDSVIVTFKANTIQVSNINQLQVIIWGDSSFVNFLNLTISCGWKTGNYDYRFAAASPKKKLNRIQYFLQCYTSSSYIAVRNINLWKK